MVDFAYDRTAEFPPEWETMREAMRNAESSILALADAVIEFKEHHELSSEDIGDLRHLHNELALATMLDVEPQKKLVRSEIVYPREWFYVFAAVAAVGVTAALLAMWY